VARRALVTGATGFVGGLLTGELAAGGIGLVTPVDAAIARPLIEGLSTLTTVTLNSSS
jgi:uncharacterized protein YbjT (DUF2867 family)